MIEILPTFCLGILFLLGLALLTFPVTRLLVRLAQGALILLSAGAVFLALFATWQELPGPELLGRPVPWVLAAYLVVSALTFFAYGYDKRAARKQKWRLSGRALHTLSLCCGWPGALLGQRVFRHKTNWRREGGFKALTWLIILLHAGFWAWWVFGR